MVYGVSTTILVLLSALLIYLVWYRFRAEALIAREVFRLNDRQKKYIQQVISKGRVEQSDQAKDDAVLIDVLVDECWLYRLADGTLISDQKTDYLKSKIAV